jgi:hypothetical protein
MSTLIYSFLVQLKTLNRPDVPKEVPSLTVYFSHQENSILKSTKHSVITHRELEQSSPWLTLFPLSKDTFYQILVETGLKNGPLAKNDVINESLGLSIR